MRKLLLSTALLALMACSPAAQDTGAASPAAAAPAGPADDSAGLVIDVDASWMRPHPQGRDVTAAYFTVQLAGESSDQLMGARIDGAERVELHGHSVDSDTGMMRMERIGPQEFTPAEPIVFAPGARHLMVFGLAPVAAGDTVSGVLVFEHAGEVPVTFEVRNTARRAPAAQD